MSYVWVGIQCRAMEQTAAEKRKASSAGSSIRGCLAAFTGRNMDREEMKHKYRGWHSMNEERELAEKWAAKVHLRASDNPVMVPPKPEFLEKYPPLSRSDDGMWPTSRRDYFERTQ